MIWCSAPGCGNHAPHLLADGTTLCGPHFRDGYGAGGARPAWSPRDNAKAEYLMRRTEAALREAEQEPQPPPGWLTGEEAEQAAMDADGCPGWLPRGGSH